MGNSNRIEKSETVDGVTYQYSADWIYNLESEEHWRLYWNQQKISENKVLPGDSVLEIGVGTGFTANYLKSKGVNVTTIDIDEEKQPDIKANIVTYEFEQPFDHVMAFEVFEHIPYEQFANVLSKLRKCCNKYIFFSIPFNRYVAIDFRLKLKRFRARHFKWTPKRGKIIESHHFWEIDHAEITWQKLEVLFEKHGFELDSFHDAFLRRFVCLKPKTS